MDATKPDAGRSLSKDSVEVFSVLDETARQARQLDSGRKISLDAATNLKVMGDRDSYNFV